MPMLCFLHLLNLLTLIMFMLVEAIVFVNNALERPAQMC